jgi:tetratricopeptide (TPR) repeat protein
MLEMASDNARDNGSTYSFDDQGQQESYLWKPVTDMGNDYTKSLWDACYGASAAANQALAAIDEMGNPASLQPQRGEALLARAWAHFQLANVFCLAYNPQTADKDLGLPYAVAPETQVSPQYERGTMKELYEHIAADIEAGIPLINDNIYTVPKYHFNQKAAYAFAARFYLYYGKFEKSVEYATKCLGSEPSAMLRDWQYQSTMTQKYTAIVEHYIDASLNCNLLLMTAYSKMGLAFGPYYVYSRYSHGNYLAATETGEAIPNLWNGSNETYYMGMKEYEATNLDKTMFWKLPYLFEYTDPVARIGYYRTVYPAFTADQVLLERAEANVLQGKYDEALDDVNVWIRNIASADPEHLPRTLDLDRVNTWFNNQPYHVWDSSSVKKHLNPKFTTFQEGSTQENMIQCVLALKRVETLGQGLRWFDVKRYGIQLDRRIINADGRPYRNTGTLVPFDKRSAVQIPKKVRDAGITPNPRDNQ